jgi:6-phosphogluconolactonase
MNTPREHQAHSAAEATVTRRSFVKKTAALSVAAATGALSAPVLHADPLKNSSRILVGSDTEDGILSFAWDAKTGELKPEGIATKVSQSTWIAKSPDAQYLYVACELDKFEGKPTGAVGSYKLDNGKLTPIGLVPSSGKGTCHLNIDRTGHAVICANYAGGTATSFVSKDGALTQVSNEVYTGHGPVADRQEMAHAHFISFSPDNKFVYVNDLGSDLIHIYKLDAATAALTAAGEYKAQPGDGPRTLHFHPTLKIAYCVNELNSSATVLAHNPADGSLTPIQTVGFSPRPKDEKGRAFSNTGCDAVLTRDGKFAYFANRGDDFILGFHIGSDGKLTEFAQQSRVWSGGTTPRNFTLDPTERWMLVANQSSSNLTVLSRDPKTGVLSVQGKNYPAATPMCIVFV